MSFKSINVSVWSNTTRDFPIKATNTQATIISNRSKSKSSYSAHDPSTDLSQPPIQPPVTRWSNARVLVSFAQLTRAQSKRFRRIPYDNSISYPRLKEANVPRSPSSAPSPRTL